MDLEDVLSSWPHVARSACRCTTTSRLRIMPVFFSKAHGDVAEVLHVLELDRPVGHEAQGPAASTGGYVAASQ
jgi:hypothetical protein